MGYNFIEWDRDQAFLLPLSVREWIDEDDFCWFAIEAVARMDTTEFLKKFNPTGAGGMAYNPNTMISIIICAYAAGVRSSRKIETLCRRDVAFRTICGTKPPDHTTISRFRKNNASRLERIFRETLKLCADAGVLDPNVVAVDGTKIRANASIERNVKMDDAFNDLARRWLEEADRIDAEEDEKYGSENPYGRVPKALADPAKRKKFLDEWEKRKKEPEAVQKKQAEVLKRRKAHEEETGETDGPRSKSPLEVKSRAEKKTRQVNTTDPESRIMKDHDHHLQGYNVQMGVTDNQLIVSAEIYNEASDAELLHPVIESAEENISSVDPEMKIEKVVADAGYLSYDNAIRRGSDGPELYIATKKDRVLRREIAKTSGESKEMPENLTAWENLHARHQTPEGKKLFKRRSATVEPVFGQIKEGRKCRSFMVRGLELCRGELMLIAAVHNLLKLQTLTRE